MSEIKIQTNSYFFNSVDNFLGGFERLHAVHGRRGVRRQDEGEGRGGEIEQEVELSNEPLDDVHIFTFGYVKDENHVGTLES